MSLDTERIRGKLCVLTGAAQSIGFDIGKRYAEYGANVVLIDINPAVINSALILTEKGHAAQGYVLDVTDHDSVMDVFAEVTSKHGPVFSLVNAAGIMEISPFEDTTPALWQKVININLLGTVNCIQGAIGGMREAREGKIMNFSSKAGKMGSKLMTVYGASKGAIITLTQALAMEYAEYRLNINCLCPDIIDDTGVWHQASAMYSSNLAMPPEEVKQLYQSKVPLGRFATKEDVTDMVCFYTISGDDCTGQAINITGGRCMQ